MDSNSAGMLLMKMLVNGRGEENSAGLKHARQAHSYVGCPFLVHAVLGIHKKILMDLTDLFE